MKYIDLGFNLSYSVQCYLARNHIECEITPIIGGVARWPKDTFDCNLREYHWRLTYHDTDDGAITKTIADLVDSLNKGLKYCPHCAGFATVGKHYVRIDNGLTWKAYVVKCTSCDSVVWSDKSEEAAIKAWNRRA